MGERTGIEWTDATWNPIRGVRGKWSCVKVSPGCANCYAETANVRFGGPRYVAGADDLRLDEEVLTQPLRWSRPRRIFVCSMTDLFEERVRDEWVARVFIVMSRSPHHTFQILTKRADRMCRFITDPIRTLCASSPRLSATGGRWPLLNVWLGCSTEDQARADERVPDLLRTPAAVRFVSAEPLLGPIRLPMSKCASDSLLPYAHRQCMANLDWVIVGGESGPGARPCDLAWVRSIRDQCRAAGVRVFVKQLGARPFGIGADELERTVPTHWRQWPRDRKGGDPAEWPEDLRVREWPTP